MVVVHKLDRFARDPARRLVRADVQHSTPSGGGAPRSAALKRRHAHDLGREGHASAASGEHTDMREGAERATAGDVGGARETAEASHDQSC